MNHKNILKIYDIIFDSNESDIYIVSEYFPADL